VSEHTPAPWTIEGVGVGGHYKTINGARIVDCNGVCVATISRKADKPIDQKRADARLIVEAPDLLAAAQSLVSEELAERVEIAINQRHGGDCNIIDAMKIALELSGMSAAITKATRERPANVDSNDIERQRIKSTT
jgi:hypothetical protein